MSNFKAIAEKENWTIWISQKVGSEVSEGDIKALLETKFERLELAYNMRNTKQIISITQEWDREQKKEQVHIQKMQPLTIHPEVSKFYLFSRNVSFNVYTTSITLV